MDLNIKHSSLWWLLLLVTVILFLLVNFVWPDGNYRLQTIDGDGRGYYDYLPTLFIDKTVDFKQTFEYEKTSQPLEYLGHNFHEINGVYINKFTVGTALMILPFYWVAQVVSLIAGLPADGHSILFQYAVALAALAWLWVGFFFFRKLLRSYKISESIIVATVLGLLLATNLFHYAFVEVAFSHVYSFAAITSFLYFSRLVFIVKDKKYALLSAFTLGLVVLIRPVNGLVILAVPVLADNPEDIQKSVVRLFGSFKTGLLIALMFLSGIFPQLLINYLQTGNPIVYGYRGEGFDFLHPHLAAFLFGFKKGWFVYTPVMLLLIPAMIASWRKSKHLFWSFLLFFTILVYVFSSWWNWYYGDGFGMRPMVEYYGLFGLITALWIEKQKLFYKRLVLLVVVVFSMLNVVQTYQYSKGIIDVDSMTREAYRYVFLRISDQYRNVIGSGDESYYGKLTNKPLLESVHSFDAKIGGWSATLSPDTGVFKSSPKSFRFSQDVPYSPSFSFVADSLYTSHKLYLKLSLNYFEPTVDASVHALYVVDIRDSLSRLKFYKAFRIKRLSDKVIRRWRKSHIGIVLPNLNRRDKVKLYCWNKRLRSFNIDDFRVALYGIH